MSVKRCEFCKKYFLQKSRQNKTYKLKQRFCSNACRFADMKNKTPKNLKLLNKLPRTEDWKNKQSIANSGERHYAWITDRSKINKNKRNTTEYIQWVKSVKARDYYRCKINNKDCSGRIEVHHILSWTFFPELRYEINNGITLCHAHHPNRRAEEKRLVPFFQGLVSVSN